MCHVKRHAMEMDFTTACDENGYLTGMKAVLYADTGAYASFGKPGTGARLYSCSRTL